MEETSHVDVCGSHIKLFFWSPNINNALLKRSNLIISAAAEEAYIPKAGNVSAQVACKIEENSHLNVSNWEKSEFSRKFEQILKVFKDPANLLYSGQEKSNEKNQKIAIWREFLNAHILRDWFLKKGVF